MPALIVPLSVTEVLTWSWDGPQRVAASRTVNVFGRVTSRAASADGQQPAQAWIQDLTAPHIIAVRVATTPLAQVGTPAFSAATLLIPGAVVVIFRASRTLEYGLTTLVCTENTLVEVVAPPRQSFFLAVEEEAFPPTVPHVGPAVWSLRSLPQTSLLELSAQPPGRVGQCLCRIRGWFNVLDIRATVSAGNLAPVVECHGELDDGTAKVELFCYGLYAESLVITPECVSCWI
eukprot:TRINITY_DN5754_c0_g1_i21.p1 TRINITY_DN5754_c0_g1~~TRINITY_DN5754_c0_g1_i21.p1  ORF type:complete len:233 (-),score=29.82 TRINITY_DN5754_c0_g1_i21:407-1105(-)